MKICFLSDPTYLHIQRWARYFLEQGHEVSIVGEPHTKPTHIPGIKTYILADHEFKGPWILRTTLALKRLLNEIKPDILHMHYLAPLIAPAILRFKPFVVSVWGADIVGETGLAKDHWRMRFLKRLVLRHADAVLASSRFLANATCQYAKFPEERVPVYYWGVDLQQFPPAQISKKNGKNDQIVIGFVKHLVPKYGVEYLLRAIPVVRKKYPMIKILLLGEGTLRQALEKLAADLDIADVVHFLGPISHAQVPKYLEQMDIFVMPSVYESETFGVAAVEAQAMGIPVIATKVGGVPEAVADGVTGILVPPRNSDALAEAIIRLIEDNDLRESMSHEGPRFVARHFDWGKNAGRVEELYDTLISRHAH
jgi:glycosyltransferase involved in cell wall biosynthesis